MVEERIDNSSSTGRPSTGDMRELYLGLLYPTEDFKVYPLINQIRFVLLSKFTDCIAWTASRYMFEIVGGVFYSIFFLFTGLSGLKFVFCLQIGAESKIIPIYLCSFCNVFFLYFLDQPPDMVLLQTLKSNSSS